MDNPPQRDYRNATWATWRLKSTAIYLFSQQLVWIKTKKTSKIRIAGLNFWTKRLLRSHLSQSNRYGSIFIASSGLTVTWNVPVIAPQSNPTLPWPDLPLAQRWQNLTMAHWPHVIFGDESSFELCPVNGRLRVCRLPGERFKQRYQAYRVQDAGGSAHISGELFTVVPNRFPSAGQLHQDGVACNIARLQTPYNIFWMNWAVQSPE